MPPRRNVYRSRRWADRIIVFLFAGVIAAIAAVGILRDRPQASAEPQSHESLESVESTTATTAVTATALDIGLVAAFDAAQAAAAEAGETLTITSGFRTAAEQQALFDQEVAERGSVEAAAPWVFPPDRSMHVRGLAIDVGDGPAADWLAAEGHRWGLCQTLGWEWWHFEWRQAWEDSGRCPDPATDPSEAPSA